MVISWMADSQGSHNVQQAPPAAAFRVTPAGLLEWCGDDDSAATPAELQLRIAAANPALLMARLAAVPLRLNREALSAFMLVVVCSNSGNYGLPVALLAFGPEALAFASVYFISSSIFSYTGGVLLAASGRRSLPQALAGVVRVPAVRA